MADNGRRGYKTMTRILLDTYCKQGGATKGYQKAGFYVVGVDIEPQPRYCGDEFIQADAIEFLARHAREFDVIHASPPCQRYSTITRTAGTQDNHADLIAITRTFLLASGKPYIIENVETAPLINPLLLCGTMFGLPFLRHRLFETNPPIYFAPAPCCHTRKTARHGRPATADEYVAFTGHFSGVARVQKEVGIDWMGQEGLRECVPPVFTEWLGKHF